MSLPFDVPEFRRQLLDQLAGNILPFWRRHAVDEVRGGFHGAVTNDLQILDDVPRSCTLVARILWTFSAAYRRLGNPDDLAVAQRAFEYLRRAFWDAEYGGLYWEVDRDARPISDRKHAYAQAFGIYGLAEYHRATGAVGSLELAQSMFRLLEEHAFDPLHDGYFEGCGRRWEALADMRLSDRDQPCDKSMNTLLHVLEAYTNLRREWGDPRLAIQHRALLQTFLERVVDRDTGHLRLFFDRECRSLQPNVSFGHDIESSWLLCEAAEVAGDVSLSEEARRAALSLADGVLRDGLDDDGSLFYESGPHGLLDDGKAWWPQAEGVVGFFNAYQISGRIEFARASYRCWRFCLDKLVDRTHGDWFHQLARDGTPDLTRFKIGPWDCPYHHGRACIQMLDRLPVG